MRCTVHTRLPGKNEDGEPRFMNVYAINEHNLSRSNWRKEIDSNVIPILNKEIEDNSFRTSRWFVQSLLAGAEQMKLAFVTRKNMSENDKHIVLGTHTLQTKSWATQINIYLDSMWSIINYIVECVLDEKQLKIARALEEGKIIDHEKL